MKNISCVKCRSKFVIKYGIRKGKQRYRCIKCKSAFVLDMEEIITPEKITSMVGFLVERISGYNVSRSEVVENIKCLQAFSNLIISLNSVQSKVNQMVVERENASAKKRKDKMENTQSDLTLLSSIKPYMKEKFSYINSNMENINMHDDIANILTKKYGSAKM